MKNLGTLLMIIGVIWGIYSYNMQTSISTDSLYYSAYVPSMQVHNLDLADKRRDNLIGAGVTLITGVLLFGFGSLQQQNESEEHRAARAAVNDTAMQSYKALGKGFGYAICLSVGIFLVFKMLELAMR